MTNPLDNFADKDLLRTLSAAMSRRLPGGVALASRAIADELGANADDREWIKINFSTLVENSQLRAYRYYLEAERPAACNAFEEAFGASAERGFQDFFTEHFFTIDRFFLGLTQGRRPRAGKAFELVIKELFGRLQYPYSPQPIINGQPDFLLPSVTHFQTNAMVACRLFLYQLVWESGL